MTRAEMIDKATVKMTEAEYFDVSDDRRAVTPENLAGLLEYPALYQAMKDNRDLRPALGEGQRTGRVFNDFMSLTPEEFATKYVVAAGPVNPKTNKPYGTDTKAYQEWRSSQTKTPVTPEQFNLFGLMAKAYAAHPFVKNLSAMTCLNNVVLGARFGDNVDVLFKVDKLYVGPDAVIAVDLKTTDDLCGFTAASARLKYHAQQALLLWILKKAGIEDAQVRIAVVEKGPLPRCGIFEASEIGGTEIHGIAVTTILEDYSKSLKTGVFSTGFEGQALI